MKVYVVTSGSYSDYRISHVFATREVAEAFLADFHARAEKASALGGGTVWTSSYYGDDYNPDIDEWEVLEAAPGLYEHWAAHWTEDSGLSRYATRTDQEAVDVVCHEISTDADDVDTDPPILHGVDYYHFMLDSPPDTPLPYRGPKERPPRTVSGNGRTPEAALKAMHDKKAFLEAVRQGIA